MHFVGAIRPLLVQDAPGDLAGDLVVAPDVVPQQAQQQHGGVRNGGRLPNELAAAEKAHLIPILPLGGGIIFPAVAKWKRRGFRNRQNAVEKVSSTK